MANRSVTIEVAFVEIPILGAELFAVRPGLDAATALSTAECLYESVQHLVGEGIHDDAGVSAETAYLYNFALKAAYALRVAAGAAA